MINCLKAQHVPYYRWCLENVLSFHTSNSALLKIFCLFRITLILVSWSRLKRSKQDGCFSKVGLPLIENSTIVQQPLDLWTLTEQYKSVATRIIQNARYKTVTNALIVALKHSHLGKGFGLESLARNLSKRCLCLLHPFCNFGLTVGEKKNPKKHTSSSGATV